jgi:hypothetical protein
MAGQGRARFLQKGTLMELKYIHVTISGATPLMMHNDRLANPMNEYARMLKEISSKRTKTDADIQEMSKIEFLGGIYYSRDTGVYMPGRNVRKSIVEGGRKIKKGKAIETAVTVSEEAVSLVYNGPREPAKLFEQEPFVDVRMVKPTATGGRVLRTRPVFAPPWSLSFTLEYFPEQINANDLRQCAEIAGQLVGIGDYRPGKSGGTFGKFRIAEWSVA